MGARAETIAPQDAVSPHAQVFPKAEGFRGIWFDLGQKSEFGSKYSGGLGTYTANHVPMAHYVKSVNRTYFTWGGTPAADQRKLLILISCFDHTTGLAARPVVVMDKSPVNDPHVNASLSIAADGRLWIFVSGRNVSRLGAVFRSKQPHDISDWDRLPDWEFTYPQPWCFEAKGFFHTYTRYTAGRELYFRTSANGEDWSKEKKLAGIGGHYQTSEQVGERILTAFNRHPGRNVDRRTDLYYLETPDMGETWTTADGTALTIPLTNEDNPARIRNYSGNPAPADNALVYIHDVTADADGHPVILYLTSKHHQPGPQGDPRTWMVARWTGSEWLFHAITTSTHNYDTGSIHIEEDGTWKVIGPTGAGPQKWGTGGEIEIWTSTDQGATWAKQRAVTSDSPRNHSYARRPRNAHPDFHTYWSDGNADEFSESHLWFTNQAGDKLWCLPYTMTDDFAVPAQQTPTGEKDLSAEVDAMLKIGVPEEANAPAARVAAPGRLPNVLLIGDSIAGGYLGEVQSRLKGVAHVERGNNGGTTQSGIESIERILGDREWDLIHFNWGLHDMTWQRRMKPEERGIEAYAARLDQLVTRLRKTNAKLVWATTTPWPENNYAYYEQRFGKKLVYPPAEEQQWRDAALAVIEKHQIPVNDLHALLKPDLKTYQKTDDVHFNRDGNRAMAEQIAKVVRPMLPQVQGDGGEPGRHSSTQP